MTRCLLVIFTNPTPGREEEFDAWYETHLEHMLELEDCVSAQRFGFAPYDDDEDPPHRHLAIYEFETDDVAATQARLGARMGSATMPSTDAKQDTVGWYFAPIGERRT